MPAIMPFHLAITHTNASLTFTLTIYLPAAIAHLEVSFPYLNPAGLTLAFHLAPTSSWTQLQVVQIQPYLYNVILTNPNKNILFSILLF
jgi:hypothetical protein